MALCIVSYDVAATVANAEEPETSFVKGIRGGQLDTPRQIYTIKKQGNCKGNSSRIRR